MKKVIFKSIVFFLLLLPLNCGFKVVDKSKLNKFSIKEISISGDKRINFKIKNNLIIDTGKKNEKLLLIDLNTRKIKTIKEKNIKNEITKYQIEVATLIKFNLIETNELGQFLINLKSDYIVAERYSQTLNNEKKVIKILAENIANEIIEEILIRLNDI